MTDWTRDRTSRLLAGVVATLAVAALLLTGGGPAAVAASTPPGLAPGFHPESMSWVSGTDGFVLGRDTCGAATCTRVWRTTDAGATWSLAGRVPLPLAPSGEHGVTGLAMVDDTVGWAHTPDLERTGDGGRTWAASPLPGGDRQVVTLTTTPGATYLLTSHCEVGTGICDDTPLHLWRTTGPRSTTWRPVPVDVPADWHVSISSAGANTVVLAAPFTGPGTLTVLRDGASPVRRQAICPDPVGDSLLVAVAATAPRRFAMLCDGTVGMGSSDKTVLTTSDLGATFSYSPIPGRLGVGSQLAAAPTGGLVVSTVTANLVFARPPLRKTWVPTDTYLPGDLAVRQPTFTRGDTVWAVLGDAQYQDSLLIRSTDAGRTWSPAPMPPSATGSTHPATQPSRPSQPTTPSPRRVAQRDTTPVCDSAPSPGQFTCFALRRTDVATRTPGQLRALAAAPAGYGPADLRSAYGLPALAGSRGQRVYVVVAYDAPTAEADLAVYRSQFGLPACTTANGCFQKVNQQGRATPLPAPSAGWAGEASLDLAMVSAVCPRCGITLVEADTPSDDLLAAARTAARLGGRVVSMSWGRAEGTDGPSLDAEYLRSRGVVYSASTGDFGYGAGVSYPASSGVTTAVGGTSLTRGGGGTRGWSETAWVGAGSGCSAAVPRPAWQTVPDSVCPRRAVADVSAVADPQTGVAVYDSYGGAGGWGVYGGTSASAPIIAAASAAAGAPDPASQPASYPWAHRSAFTDVTSGSTGACEPGALCTAGPGWDGPTGLGTPVSPAALAAPTPGDVVTVAQPAAQTSVVGTPVRLAVAASSPRSRVVAWRAVDLPQGLTVDDRTGTVSGRPTEAGTFATTLVARDATGATGVAAVTWVVSTRAGARGVVNGDFESGPGGWVADPGVIVGDGLYARSGDGYAWLGGYGETHTDSLAQQVTVPTSGDATLRFWLRVASEETDGRAHDRLRVTVDGTPLLTVSDTAAGGGYRLQALDLSAYRGRTVRLAWTSTEDDDGLSTTFLVDDVSLTP
ncbi:putative Ig domain-containing protein [Terracoccus luteus]|uniref:Peptidase S53 domain-containing protein n=1 Tax=Terracoccus luteus TaxID=53356 RepID=A0A839PY48_9MICO|nr:putative Ig domain-containing protein [Terracoccus luteus]MBB2988053.1 hypothetical protein [Terracoccus luteus]MCP2173704.1 hypothetical protein [Terracoccus luteus]